MEEGRCQGPGILQSRQRRAGRRRGTAKARRPKLAEARLDRMARSDNRHVITVADAKSLARAAADRIMARIAANGDRVAICLTGGSSPKQLYQLLATDTYRSQIPWQRVHWFIGDERFVPADDPLNNMGAARRIFLDRYAPASNIHAIPTDTASPEH